MEYRMSPETWLVHEIVLLCTRVNLNQESTSRNAIFNRYGILGPFWDTYYTTY